MARSVATWPSRMVGFVPAARLDGHASLAMTRKGPRADLKKVWHEFGGPKHEFVTALRVSL
jgi:hypothetical protein